MERFGFNFTIPEAWIPYAVLALPKDERRKVGGFVGAKVLLAKQAERAGVKNFALYIERDAMAKGWSGSVVGERA